MSGVVTAPDAMHEIDARGVEILLVFVDPESTAGASLHACFAEPYRAIDPRERDALVRSAPRPEEITAAGGDAWSSLAVATLGNGAGPPARRVHPRVRRLLARLRTAESTEEQTLTELAALVGLSPGRLMHVFTESLGIPLRPYLAWLRLQRAAAGVVAGNPLAEVAAAAGFSDAAHMTRTFRRMLGTPPSALRRITK
jgi:transcriptional regulator GlxA family with amidase domain